MAIGFGLAAALTLLGVVLAIASDGSSGFGVLASAAGMVMSVTFALLYFFSVFTTISVLGVVLGVAALTVVLAVTSGMQQEFREKVLGVNAHIIIQKNAAEFTEYKKVEEQVRKIDSRIIAVQPFNFINMVATRGRGEVSSVAVKGIDPARVNQVLDLHRHMLQGKVESLAVRPKTGELAPIILGRVLADKLSARVGDDITVVTPLSNFDVETMTAQNDAPRSKTFRVTGIFYSGFDEYDRHLMYIHIADSQELLDQGDQVQGIELKLSDVDAAPEIADKIEKELGDARFFIQDWNELNRSLFSALELQKVLLWVILSLIILVAAFNMVSALTMMVIDKVRAIAILRSMGATATGVARLFQVVGIGIGAAGTIGGVSIGLVLCKLMSGYNYRLDPQVYLIDRLPIAISALEVWLVAGVTMLICTLATLFPSFKASSLAPVEGLRYE